MSAKICFASKIFSYYYHLIFLISLSTQTKISDKDEDGESRGVECVGGGEAVEGDEAGSVDKAAQEALGDGHQGTLLQDQDDVVCFLFRCNRRPLPSPSPSVLRSHLLL